MQGCFLQARAPLSGKVPFLGISGCSPCPGITPTRISDSLRCRCISRLKSLSSTTVVQASNANIGAGGYEGSGGNDSHKSYLDGSTSETSSEPAKPLSRVPYPLSIAGVLLGCGLAFSLIAFLKGGPSALVSVIAKSGFTAAFTLIFVSEIGDKTFFIAALLAMQYDKLLVLLGSMGALGLMTILSVAIGRIFRSVPAQFQTIGSEHSYPC